MRFTRKNCKKVPDIVGFPYGYAVSMKGREESIFVRIISGVERILLLKVETSTKYCQISIDDGTYSNNIIKFNNENWNKSVVDISCSKG